MPLHCTGHPGLHDLGLTMRLGGSTATVADVVRHALPCAFLGEEDNPAASIALDVLDRARHGEPEVSDEEAAALITAMESAREYMITNRYADDETFPEDAATARALDQSILVDVCWRDR